MPQQRELKKGETAEAMYDRIYSEILSRPSKYFITSDKVFSRERKRYGVKMYRNEFNLDAIADRYKQVVIELLSARWSNNFYRNFKSCNNILPGISCDMINICKTNAVSETMYQIRKKP